MRAAGSWSVIVLATACGGGNKQGEIGGHCYPNGTCNVTLACAGGICIAAPIDAAVPRDAPHDAPGDAAVDAPYACNVEGAVTGNQSITTAYQTPVAIQRKNVTYATLAICPATEKDYFRVDLTGTQNIEALVTYDDPAHGGVALQMAIVNGADVALVNATPVMAMPFTIRAFAANLPMASSPFYVQVHSNGVGEDNYSLTINVTP
jgi:hypothetical protein